jgi:hypothetical protein
MAHHLKVSRLHSRDYLLPKIVCVGRLLEHQQRLVVKKQILYNKVPLRLQKKGIFMLVIIKNDNQQQYDKKNEKIQLTPLLERPNIT